MTFRVMENYVDLKKDRLLNFISEGKKSTLPRLENLSGYRNKKNSKHVTRSVLFNLFSIINFCFLSFLAYSFWFCCFVMCRFLL